MIKVIDDTCTIEGSKDEITTELKIATCSLLKYLNTVDKFILLYILTDAIIESLKEKINEDE